MVGEAGDRGRSYGVLTAMGRVWVLSESVSQVCNGKSGNGKNQWI